MPRSFAAAGLAVCAALCLVHAAAAAPPFTLNGRVVAIADGDTLTLLDATNVQHRIRVDGIDAPERSQPYSQRARQRLADLAFEKPAVARCSKTDRFGRSVCRVFVDDVDLGLALLQDGLAWFFRRYAHELPPEVRTAYEAAEQQARAQQRGLWRDPAPTPPWEFRAANRTETP